MVSPVDSSRALFGDGYPPLQRGNPDRAIDAVHELPLQNRSARWERSAMAGYREDSAQGCL
ncbi:hypothetical protein GCM10007901_20370 [Dyella acidisoli]|uniref:Uncharacterized protein n=1 Tax=Dyella acidisoli TaxID=1867834 RepID=A0ABQ5XMZ9_9GAMM|nr:hypothetical protein GCM10007901_20370 [Dyella acidisoli]